MAGEPSFLQERHDGWWLCARRKKPGVGPGELGAGVLVRAPVEEEGAGR